MPVQFIPMQQQPGPLEGFQTGSNVGAHIVDTYQQARAAAVEHELAKLRLQHAAQMAPLEELQARNNIDLAPLIAQSHTDLAKAAMMRAGVDPHTAKVLSPEAAKLMDARAQNQMAQADYHTKAAAMYDQLHSGTKGATTRPASDASMTTGAWLDDFIAHVPPSALDDKAVLHSLVQLEIARHPERYNRSGHGVPPDLEQNIFNAADAALGGRRAEANRQANAQFTPTGGPLKATPQPAPQGVDNMAAFAQHYQQMRNAAQSMGGAMPELPTSQAAPPMQATQAEPYDPTAGALKASPGAGSTAQAAAPSPAATPATPTVTTAEQLAAIPAGATFVYKGRTHVKQ